ncbi:MAG: cytochrome P450 [Gammaproteobacteria bacterium]|nr:cytochrome P450 [Gammaproteobacteria bacterium]
MSPRIPTELIAPIFNPTTFTQPDKVDEIFTRLRKEYPLAVAEVPGFDPYWIVTKNEDIREICRNGEVFHNGDRSKMLVSKAAEDLIRDYTGGEYNILKTLVHMDGDEHVQYRRVIQPKLMPRNIAEVEPTVRAIARSFIDKLEASGPEMDFAADIAFQYPLRVIGTLIGVPEEDHPLLLKLTQWMFNYADPDLRRPGADPNNPAEQTETWNQVYHQFKDYFDPVIEDRKGCPRDDLATLISNGKVGGCPMEHRAQISYFVIASTAGHDTTAATTATAMWLLAERPDLLAQLKADPSLLPAFIEETIRWASPVKHFVRSAASDYVLRGQQIKKGDLMYLSYVSGNRDEEVFGDPFTFRLDRKPNQHVGFSYGAHICVGQHLARMELRIFWEELLPRLESVELTGKPRLAIADLVCGPKSIPIRFRMKRQAAA